jgi:hypothetical protein
MLQVAVRQCQESVGRKNPCKKYRRNSACWAVLIIRVDSCGSQLNPLQFLLTEVLHPNRSLGLRQILCHRQKRQAQIAIHFLFTAWIWRTSVSISSAVSLPVNLGMWLLPLAMMLRKSSVEAAAVFSEMSEGPPK